MLTCKSSVRKHKPTDVIDSEQTANEPTYIIYNLLQDNSLPADMQARLTNAMNIAADMNEQHMQRQQDLTALKESKTAKDAAPSENTEIKGNTSAPELVATETKNASLSPKTKVADIAELRFELANINAEISKLISQQEQGGKAITTYGEQVVALEGMLSPFADEKELKTAQYNLAAAKKSLNNTSTALERHKHQQQALQQKINLLETKEMLAQEQMQERQTLQAITMKKPKQTQNQQGIALKRKEMLKQKQQELKLRKNQTAKQTKQQSTEPKIDPAIEQASEGPKRTSLWHKILAMLGLSQSQKAAATPNRPGLFARILNFCRSCFSKNNKAELDSKVETSGAPQTSLTLGAQDNEVKPTPQTTATTSTQQKNDHKQIKNK